MLPLGLSMLWEQVDPNNALRERFGFDGFPAVVDWLSQVLDEVWGLSIVGCRRMVISDQNAIIWVESDRGGLVVKWSRAGDRFANLEASARLVRVLGGHGVPVAAPIASADGRDRVRVDGPAGMLSLAVLPELAGDWLDTSDVAAVRGAGIVLAELHEALRVYPADRHLAAPRSAGLKSRVEGWLADHDRGLAPTASHRLKALVAGLPDIHDEAQLIHNDYRAANILTRDSTIVGVLDFDEIVWDHRVNDLAVACIYLTTRFTDWRPTSAVVRRVLRAGYESVRPLEAAESDWFEVVVLWQAIMAIPGADDIAGWADAL